MIKYNAVVEKINDLSSFFLSFFLITLKTPKQKTRMTLKVGKKVTREKYAEINL